jgi:DNA-directed RNA polymerase alpha subunit
MITENTKIIDLVCTARTKNCLRGAGFQILADLQLLPRKKIMGLRNCGKAVMIEIDKILLEAGITLEP